MKLEVEPIRVETAHPFKIARETKQVRDIFVLTLEADGVRGMGEAAPQGYYGEDAMTVRSAVNAIGRLLDAEPSEVRRRLNQPGEELHQRLQAHASVRAALDMALWDHAGRCADAPVWSLIGADPLRAPLTSFTIGIDRPDVIDARVDAAAAYQVLKVKVGLPGDLEIVDRVMTRSGKVVRVDANEGWDAETALEKTLDLYRRGVEFCEQPIAREDVDGLRQLKLVSPLPVVLDESISGPDDVDRCHDQGHGINIKLMKCGGITPALQMIERARAHGLKVMIGCMLETSLGVTAAAHLSPLADWADLDGNLLLADDPFEGVTVVAGRLVLPREPGLGVRRR
ncbi:MAG: dipeptide epimerase [Candidatus Krumholzibacteria bacterium]|nr:dipeptide epimerase [Candidatus Krumholzibacteria bacterium]MDH4336028.1 dipeptide epimerase [Candidatus Krumholzibacteria bacterium]MDH5268396.1 dipeptide epimerase [Candidatus Krumholzibacteria bacterium]MDH5628241.1 dipeptide epimerase [Candidatus Krumholzibacteria bacterium]